MSNKKNLARGPEYHALTFEDRSRGGKKSAETRKRRKELKEAMEILLSKDVKDKKGVVQGQGVDVIATALFKKASSGDVSAYLALRDTVGEKPVDRIAEEELRIRLEQHEMAKKEWEEQRAPKDELAYVGIPASMIAPWFGFPHHAIQRHEVKEFVFPGGRGSTKSSAISLELVDLMQRNPDVSALVMRNVGKTLGTSVFPQVKWALRVLGLYDQYHVTVSPMKMVNKKTGQTIFFSGADDAGKIKGLKPDKGYVGILWLEELDQFAGPETVRNLEQSAIRGGDIAWIFKSFNPPRSVNSWANEYTQLPKDGMKVYRSTYLDVPPEWLGRDWLDEAEQLKKLNPSAYANEYMGEANGNGGNVFDNLEIREITEDEIRALDFFLNGVDWGYYPDPFAFVRVAYDRNRRILYIIESWEANKKSNEETAEYVKSRIPQGDIVTCDSAEEKSVADYKAFGISARSAEKGPESRRYSFKWLQSMAKIVIDPVKAKEAAHEFQHYEYERDKDGNVIEGYPDGNDHTIDATRYATNREWKRKGK